ncbi:hypothetical protein BDK92_3081 [Micromonospora pisi]|uniref:Uncharacterized protein n=1 Tax=Micromonospora pisi TaxID=589240 RepID=A0A495JIW3_9ACTN|nr:hypothetical protein [Micromonospora pisi]RKR88751.1 hypothetical protein BDK92_3081 [Micromonospora pisi]
MARVEFGRRTRTPWTGRRREADRDRAHGALAAVALTLLTATGIIVIGVAGTDRSAASAATMLAATEVPGNGGTAPERTNPDPDPDPEPSTPPSTEPPTNTPVPSTPPESPTPSPGQSTQPSDEPSQSPSPPADPPPTTAPGQSSPPPTTIPRPPEPGQPRLGVLVSTGDISLTSAYWGARSTTTELQVTIRNTGETTQLVRLRYSLPSGLTDAGTPGCAPVTGGTYRCGAWQTAAGAQFSTRIRVLVDANAWLRMPLAGSVQVTAVDPARPDAGSVNDDEGFAVLFPPGPPAAGVTLAADEIAFGTTGQPSTLVVRLGNTGVTEAGGTVEVILPDGVTVPALPHGCRATAPTPDDPAPANPDQTGTSRLGCELGRIAAGQTATARFSVAATPAAQRMAPLSGAVIGTIIPSQGRTGRMQMSFRITAAVAGVPSEGVGAMPTGSQGLLPMVRPVSQPDNGVQRTAIGLIVVSGLLVVLALTLAAVTLRRHTP